MSQASHRSALETASALHRFNRYEIKYLLPRELLERFRARLSERMQKDPHQVVPTRITSLYYDTPGLSFYWEKIDGLRFRRKLRIRVYGPPEAVTDATTVYVEIKQRVNRVTQKRRVSLPYAAARSLCDQRETLGNGAFISEVLTLCHSMDLRPIAVTTYFRDGYMGVGADVGLRVTIDQRVCGRDRDFALNATGQHRLLLPADLALVELKANERVPTWFTDLAAELNLTTVRISKYCRAVEAHELGGRALQHVRELPSPTLLRL